MPTTLLWLFVVNLGTVFGAGLYEARITTARWRGPSVAAGPGWHPEEARRDDVGRRFWGFTTTLPLTLLTLGNLWLAARASEPSRAWWLAAGVVALAERTVTFGYFIPQMVKLMGMEDSPPARARATQWVRLNAIRLLLVLAAWLCSLQALVLLRNS
jgi:hypothetical protein